MEIINTFASIAADFSGWCSQPEVKQAFAMVRNVLQVLRIVVPIALLIVTSIDIAKKVINPEEKDGQKKIMTRAIAAVIVFFIPTFIGIVFKIIDIGKDSGSAYKESRAGLSECWGGDYGN